MINKKTKKQIIDSKYNPILRFINNIRYLFKYNLKEMYNNPNINIGKVTELAAIKTKFMWDEIKVPKIKDDLETISELVNTNKSIIRFGDGEIFLMLGKNNCFEPANEKIKNILNEIFYNDIPDLLTGTRYDMFRINTDFIDYTIGSYRNVFLLKKYSKIKHLFNYNKTYYSACFIYPYLIYSGWNFDNYFDELRKIWQDKKLTIVIGNNIFKKIKYNIFDNAKEISYIFGPNKQAFKQYDSLKEKVLKAPKDNILIFILGPCGKILAYDAFKVGYRVLDLGHLIKNYDFYQRRNEMTVDEFYQEFTTFCAPD